MPAVLTARMDNPREGPRPVAPDPRAATAGTGDQQPAGAGPDVALSVKQGPDVTRSTETGADGPRPAVAVNAVEAAFLRHAENLSRYLYARTGRQQDAEDLLGEVFIQAWRYRGKIEHIDHWLYKVARNAAHRHLKRRGSEAKHRVETAAGEIDELVDYGALGGPASGIGMAQQFGLDRIDRGSPEMIALLALDDDEREILLLRALAGFQIREVAVHLEIKVAAAYQRWQRARSRYSAHLVAVGVEPPKGRQKPRHGGAATADPGDRSATPDGGDKPISPGADDRSIPPDGIDRP